LEKLGLAENTIVILWGDHGWHLGDHGIWCKHTNYEQATHAPLLISAPGRRAPQRTRAIVEFVDIYPTLCDLAELAKPAHLQGESLVPVMDTPTLKRAAAFQVYPRNPKEIGPLLGHAVRTDRWRYVEWRKADGSAAARELYDLQTDPQETLNVADQPDKSDIVNEHAALLKSRLGKPAPAGLKLLDLAAAKPAPKVDREALFARKDKDGDGKLTREEFLADQPDPEQAPKRFPKFDTDGDGVLTREEFVAAGAKR
jgi:iduronate 2-sulfatase